MLKESGETSHTCVRSPCEPTLEMRFLLIFVLFSSHSTDPPRPFFPLSRFSMDGFKALGFDPHTMQSSRPAGGPPPSQDALVCLHKLSSMVSQLLQAFSRYRGPLASSPSFGQTLWHRAPLPAIIVCLLFVLKRPYALFAFQSVIVTPAIKFSEFYQFSLDTAGALFSFLTVSLRTES